MTLTADRMSEEFPFPGFDWKQIINSQLPLWLNINGSDLVFVKDVDLIKNRLKFLKNVDKR